MSETKKYECIELLCTEARAEVAAILDTADRFVSDLSLDKTDENRRFIARLLSEHYNRLSKNLLDDENLDRIEHQLYCISESIDRK